MSKFSIEPLRGVIAPILTPFNDDLSIADDLFAAHAHKLLEQGCAALAPFGTTGEALSIAADERSNALWHLTEAGIDAKRLVPGTGLCNLKDTADFSRACLDMGCAGVMTLPPFYYKGVPEDGLYAWYARLIETVGDDMRLYLYHIPQVAGVGLPVSLVRKLRSDFPEQVVGIKDSSGDWDNTEALLGIEGLIVYPSSETALTKALPLGAPGCITATANINAAAIAEFITAFDEGDTIRVAYMTEALEKVREAAASRDFIATPKRYLALETGEDRWANVRPPFIPAPEKAALALKKDIDAVG